MNRKVLGACVIATVAHSHMLGCQTNSKEPARQTSSSNGGYVGNVRELKATWNRMPPNSVLHVSGKVDVATPCHDVKLIPGQNPTITTALPLKLMVWKSKGGECATKVETREFKWSETDFRGGRDSVVIELPDGTTASVTIQQLH